MFHLNLVGNGNDTSHQASILKIRKPREVLFYELELLIFVQIFAFHLVTQSLKASESKKSSFRSILAFPHLYTVDPLPAATARSWPLLFFKILRTQRTKSHSNWVPVPYLLLRILMGKNHPEYLAEQEGSPEKFDE
jgi:hypothetical protein